MFAKMIRQLLGEFGQGTKKIRDEKELNKYLFGRKDDNIDQIVLCDLTFFGLVVYFSFLSYFILIIAFGCL